MPLILKPDPTDKTPNHFIVLCDGVQVGLIFDRVPGASAPNATWCSDAEAWLKLAGEATKGSVTSITFALLQHPKLQ